MAWATLAQGLVDRAPGYRRRLRACHQQYDGFAALLGRQDVHAGLVCLNVAPGLMSLDVQKRLFALALDRIGNIEPINELLEVTLMEDRSVRIERYDLPPTR